jgi:hypothetical protein
VQLAMFLQSGVANIPVILIFLVFHFSSFHIIWLSVHHNHFGFLVMLWIGIVFYANLDTTFHFDANPDQDSDPDPP